MRDVQTGRKSDCHCNGRCTGTVYKCFSDRVQDNETGVTEYRDRYNPAHQFHGQFRMVFTNDMDNYICQFQCGTGFFKNCTDECTENDYDTDTGECSGKALSDNICKTKRYSSVICCLIHKRNSGNQTE